MRKTKIGVMDFHGSVDITDPCYDKDVWCRMNNVKISEGEYACYVWRHTDKGKYEDGTPYSYLLVGAIGMKNGCVYRGCALLSNGADDVETVRAIKTIEDCLWKQYPQY